MDRTVTLKAVLGERNDVTAERFAPGDLVSGVNMDIDTTGKMSLRKGRTLAQAGVFHSLWAEGIHALVVKDGLLSWVNSSNIATSLGRAIAGDRVTYAHVNGTTFFSDGLSTGVVTMTYGLRSWGMSMVDATTPTIGTGDLPAGTYQYAMTLRRSDGFESGSARARSIVLSSQGSLSWATLPTHSDASTVRVYLSRVNGDELYLAGEYPTGSTNVAIKEQPRERGRLRTMFMQAPFAGKVFGPWNGRIFIARDNFVGWTLPFRYELMAPDKDWWAFNNPVTLVQPADDGLYVATTAATYFMAGQDPASMQMRLVLPYGAVPGTSVVVPPEQVGNGQSMGRVSVWMSTQGPILGLGTGQVVNLTGQRYRVPAATSGASMFRADVGRPQYIVNLFG